MKTTSERIGDLLRSANQTLSTAESCTGGMIAHKITAVSGCSDYYKGSVVSYCNDVKMNQLGVSQSDLESHGAVSRPVVEQMAGGVRNLLATDYALATSGIAGPGGGTPEKPVGTIYIACATSVKTDIVLADFADKNNPRCKNRQLAAALALYCVFLGI